jgi:hypothetical protein
MTKPSELFMFAGRCLALDNHPEFQIEIREKLNSGEVNKDDLIWLCSNHLVMPVLFLKLKKHGLLDIFPAEHAGLLKTIYEMNRDRNLKIMQQIEEISASLKQENIPHVYLKGTGNLLDNLYSDIGERMIGDIDFLVTENDVVKTAEILVKHGYLSEEQMAGVDILPSDHHHYPGLTKKDAIACVEIHRIPVGTKYSRQFTASMVFSEARPVPGKTNVFVPSDKHKFILNFIHSQLSNSGHRHWNSSLRDFYDGYLLSEKVNRDEVLNSIEEKTKARVFYTLINRTFNLNENETYFDDVQVKRYIRIYNWWQEHPKLYNAYFGIIDFFNLIFVAYLGKIIKSVYRKSYRRYIWIRLKNPKWYKAHFILVKNKFF